MLNVKGVTLGTFDLTLRNRRTRAMSVLIDKKKKIPLPTLGIDRHSVHNVC